MKVRVVCRKFECREDIHYKTQTGTSCEKCNSNSKAFRLGIELASSFSSLCSVGSAYRRCRLSLKCHQKSRKTLAPKFQNIPLFYRFGSSSDRKHTSPGTKFLKKKKIILKNGINELTSYCSNL